MTVRDLQDGAPGGWISEDAFRVDNQGGVWVNLDAPVQMQVNPQEDLLQIRRNRQLLGDQTGLRLGRDRLIEVPAEDLVDRDLATISSPDEASWGRVELWRPWSYSWELATLPVEN